MALRCLGCKEWVCLRIQTKTKHMCMARTSTHTSHPSGAQVRASPTTHWSGGNMEAELEACAVCSVCLQQSAVAVSLHLQRVILVESR